MAGKGTRFTSLTEWMDHLKKAGAQGGKKRANNLTAEELSAIGKKGAAKRWGTKKAAAASAKVRSARAKTKSAK